MIELVLLFMLLKLLFSVKNFGITSFPIVLKLTLDFGLCGVVCCISWFVVSIFGLFDDKLVKIRNLSDSGNDDGSVF